jgi:hypothetical protein
MPSAALVILTPSLRDADLPIRLRHHGARCGSALRLSEDPPAAAALCSSHGPLLARAAKRDWASRARNGVLKTDG